jgi:Lysozyme like domain
MNMKIKRITFNKISINRKTKVLGVLSALILTVTALMALGRAVNAWFDTHTLQFNKMIQVQLQKPIEVKDRETQTKEIIQVVNELPEYDQLNDIEKYICDKWGSYKCATAIAIAKSESGLREQAIGINDNSIDVGIFQINSVHFSKEGCSLKELVDAKKNVDCAYKIYEASGWNAWSVYKSGVFKEKL